MRILLFTPSLLTGLLALPCVAGDVDQGSVPRSPAAIVFTDPVNYCKTVGTADIPGAAYQGPAVPDWMLGMLYTEQEIAAQHAHGRDVRKSIRWRCMNGAVFACIQNRTSACNKASENQIITAQVSETDERGFPVTFWDALTPPSDGGKFKVRGRPHAETVGPSSNDNDWILPKFPWPPPAASASYVVPDRLLEKYETVGKVADTIVSTLEVGGYVERSFFQTEARGVALVTRLERINDDGSPASGHNRWPPSKPDSNSNTDLVLLLRGLLFVDPGRYRVIVFILQDLPFSQSATMISEDEARAWLRSGANVLPSSVARLPFSGGHCTVLIYEFASDGSQVRLVESRLTGKEHLQRTGLLAGLESAEQSLRVSTGAEGVH